jgi:uncharacterized membrane protein YccF (DUF307 family)
LSAEFAKGERSCELGDGGYRAEMRTIGNIVWLVLAGIWLAIGYVVAGLLMFISIIGIPFGIASFRLAGYVLWPFGRTVVKKPISGVPSFIGNIIWLIFGGLEMVVAHLLVGVVLCVTIIGIPLGIVSFKMANLAFSPLGHEVVSTRDVVG